MQFEPTRCSFNYAEAFVFKLTPKAFANFSPGFELARTLGTIIKGVLTLKGFANRRTLSGFHHRFIF
jgi:hypothetical protein